MEAFAGNFEKAIALVSSVLIDVEKQKAQAFLWNDYVYGNAACLSGDMHKLKYYRERLSAKAEEHQGNKINLNILDNLIAGFGKHYEEAYNGM